MWPEKTQGYFWKIILGVFQLLFEIRETTNLCSEYGRTTTMYCMLTKLLLNLNWHCSLEELFLKHLASSAAMQLSEVTQNGQNSWQSRVSCYVWLLFGSLNIWWKFKVWNNNKWFFLFHIPLGGWFTGKLMLSFSGNPVSYRNMFICNKFAEAIFVNVGRSAMCIHIMQGKIRVRRSRKRWGVQVHTNN